MVDGAPAATDGARYLLWGSAGHARVLASLIAARGGRVVALIDNADVPAALDGVPLYRGEAGLLHWLARTPGASSVLAAVAIGGHRGRDRLALQALLMRHGLRPATLVHPDASLCPTAVVGAGSQLLAGAVVAAGARLGETCIVNHRASVDHECVLGDGVHVAPGATLCGCVTVGDNVLIGAGAVVLPRLRIGADSVVGAGAVVTREVAPGTTVVGNPARAIRPRA